ncbi:hypothetical protein B9Z55_019296 [Caenorhabditis nigoni]|uniref:Uncharacterized protein n=1 Tax=Caenorhabditis nigoni TaxID=1611254 RepID=A0A2G5THR1_9PELO|nr:hypothetical protein B9Z55_019296 [Caenorhabditis nigoni]
MEDGCALFPHAVGSASAMLRSKKKDKENGKVEKKDKEKEKKQSKDDGPGSSKGPAIPMIRTEDLGGLL